MRLKFQKRDYTWLEVHSTHEAARDDFIVWDSTVLFEEQEIRQQCYYTGSRGGETQGREKDGLKSRGFTPLA